MNVLFCYPDHSNDNYFPIFFNKLDQSAFFFFYCFKQLRRDALTAVHRVTEIEITTKQNQTQFYWIKTKS